MRDLSALSAPSPEFLKVLVETVLDGIIFFRPRRKSSRDERGRVHITIADTGRGIEPQILSRIFAPRFTTKGVGVGSGLGLAICYQIVYEDHGGEIRVGSTPQERVRLPQGKRTIFS